MLYYFLKQKSFLLILLIINLLGTIYGYIWYGDQLSSTKWPLVIFVPDSPTASLFFCIVLIFFLLGKNSGLFEALALLTLFKYGIWAVAMNIFVLIETGSLHWTGYMLMASHLAMAIQGLLYIPFYKINKLHFNIAALMLVHNEIIDYIFDVMPSYSVLSYYQNLIGYFTFWLSIFTILMCYFLINKSNKITI
ncbi:MAG: hypothetical protein K0S51_1692 [Bacillales bacterium]|jgi:uncharacterized membrane protein YpjA|nr:hypothetical protein [Bacillales bacterium]